MDLFETLLALIPHAMAEAWAALHAIIFVKEVGMFDIILEGDAIYAGCQQDQFWKPTSK
jgi:hypothetical protein